jgi:hypothetical protein
MDFGGFRLAKIRLGHLMRYSEGVHHLLYLKLGPLHGETVDSPLSQLIARVETNDCLEVEAEGKRSAIYCLHVYARPCKPVSGANRSGRYQVVNRP